MFLEIALVLLGLLVYWTAIKPLRYWKDRGVPYQKPWPLVGNVAASLFKRKAFADMFRDYYKEFPDLRYNGIFQMSEPVLLIRDIDLIKQLTVKDFDHFQDHKFLVTEDIDPLFGKNLLCLCGQRWRDMRATLSPSFTSSKMRAMFVLVNECAEQLVAHFREEVKGTSAFEMKDVFTRFTNDAIASVAFGLKCDSLRERENEFYLMGKEATTISGWRQVKLILATMSPSFTKSLRPEIFPKSVSSFFERIITTTIRQREREGLVRPDMIHLLMEARKGKLKHDEKTDAKDTGFATVEESEIGMSEKYQKREITDQDITAQALLFFFGGFDTSSTLMSFAAYEVAINPDMQERLQQEIDETLEACGGRITYEALLGMKYLDMVISETLRKWPPGFRLERICVRDYTIQPTKPQEKPLTIEKGIQIMIPVFGIHRDPKYFPNPDKFDPERFNDENKSSIKPYSYLPFGSGPRNCIGSRLALMENKALFFHLLLNFDIVPVEKTPIPLRLSPNSLNVDADKGFWLGFRQRSSKWIH